MPWEQVSIKDQDRLAQAGVALVEQTLFSNSSDFPNSFSGRMALNKQTNQVEISSPIHEFVLTNAQSDRDGSGLGATVFGREISQISDVNGNHLKTFDERWKGNMLDNAISHYSQMNLLIRDSDDSEQFKITGVALPLKETLDASFGTFKDDYAKSVTDGANKPIPLQIHFAAQNLGNNVLDIVATLTPQDASPNPKPPSTVELKMTVDATGRAANFQLIQTGF